MSKLRTCKSCGRILNTSDEVEICSRCRGANGFHNNMSSVKLNLENDFVSKLNLNREISSQMISDNLKNIPYWLEKDQKMQNKTKILITDIGSTTTKCLLLQKENGKWIDKGYETALTTVESPAEDVVIGLRKALEKLEKLSGVKLLISDKALELNEDILYLSTSSAGGGLQIAVIGLTMFDSASSAKRAAYGAGGVILDTFAIDDKRSAIEQMKAMQSLHPDMILFSGGTDSGAISGIVRLAELLSIAELKGKFLGESKTPLIFAGNVKARHFIESSLSKHYEMNFVPNLRPEMKKENLEPTREKIHNIFMNSVMEKAPGYSKVKQIVHDSIIPTPLGVIKSLELISSKMKKNVITVDIGGATTDVFSNILGHYYRTVSANYGMSYSITNVVKDSGEEWINSDFPMDLDINLVRNYCGNKMLNPDKIPENSTQLFIEHTMAHHAIKMSKHHHMSMHFNTEKIGFLDRMKKQEKMDKFLEIMYVEKKMEERKFHEKDIDIMIGSGGVFSHVQNTRQAALMLIRSLNPSGITELWRDKEFISPHLGKLSDVDSNLAEKLLVETCFEKIGLHIKPFGNIKKNGQLLGILKINGNRYDIKVGDFLFIDNVNKESRSIEIELEKNIFVSSEAGSVKFTTNLPIYLDSVLDKQYLYRKEFAEIGAYDSFSNNDCTIKDLNYLKPDESVKTGKIVKTLPYPGDIHVKIGDNVDQDTEIGVNNYEPPRIFILSLFKQTGFTTDTAAFRQILSINAGDFVKSGQVIFDNKATSLSDELKGRRKIYTCPVTGIVESINYENGTIFVREYQDYSEKPVKINLAERLMTKPKAIRGYLKKHVGDMVYTGEVLASKMETSSPTICNSPTTGLVKDIDFKKGIITIQYEKKPKRLISHCIGKVSDVKDGRSVVIEYSGIHIKGKIGFGSESSAPFMYYETFKEISNSDSMGKILAVNECPGIKKLNHLKTEQIKGLIVPGIEMSVLTEFINDEIGVALTGNENIPFPLIIMNGFGSHYLSNDQKSVFRNHSGKDTYINGETQIRAGVKRPQVIVFE